jgi:ABC-type antimicrobial peptide transport system permease subunit
MAQVYGDISGSVQGIADSATKIIKWVAIMMLIFVTIPMMSTMGKILADSQRETGVFRAFGARNRDIAKIYVVYSVILASLAFMVAILISSIITLILTGKYGGILGAQLTELAGSSTVLRVSLYGISLMHWAVLYSLLIVSAILGATIPVLRTLRKDPILAMRDE